MAKLSKTRKNKLDKAVGVLNKRALSCDYIRKTTVRKILREEKFSSINKIRVTDWDIEYIMHTYRKKICKR